MPKNIRRINNVDIATILREMAVCYAMDGVRFKPQAYQRAADGVSQHHEELAAAYARDGRAALRTADGVGEGIADHIEHLLTRATPFAEYRACKKRYPIDLLGLTAIDDVGPKRALLFYQKLRIKTVAQLEAALAKGRVAALPGVGEKTAAKITASIARLRGEVGRRPLAEAAAFAERIVGALQALPEVRQAVVAGSVRRRKTTVGDLDILVTTDEPEAVMAVFAGMPEVDAVIEHGKTLTAVRLTNGMRADVRVIPDDSFGAALQYFTGDKNHNVHVRKIAIAKGLKLNEYGLWRGKKRLAAATEEEVYRALGMRWMPPEVRTDSGEIEEALAKGPAK